MIYFVCVGLFLFGFCSNQLPENEFTRQSRLDLKKVRLTLPLVFYADAQKLEYAVVNIGNLVLSKLLKSLVENCFIIQY